MYRLNVAITEEAAEILKAKAKRYGTTMGSMITMMLLETQKQEAALDGLVIYKAEMEKQEKEQPR